MRNIENDILKLQMNINRIGFYPLFLKVNQSYYEELLEQNYIDVKEIDTFGYSVLKPIHTQIVIDDEIEEGFKIIWG